MKIDITELRGKVDFGIISIREDEYLAVFDRLQPSDSSLGGRRTYDIGAINNAEQKGHYRYALVRTISQGEGVAQDVARDMIEDLQPNLLLLVGIGGAVPSPDFTLGDVVCATRVYDFCVRAAKESESDRFSAGGGPMHKEVENILSRLPAIERQLSDWNTQDSIGMATPLLEVPEKGSKTYYGSEAWQTDVQKCLTHRFVNNRKRAPKVTARPVASSDALIKDTGLLDQWLTEARAVAAVEMELAGVYIAARRHDKEYPILAIRGISDIVGFKRDEAWTQYACNTAGAFAVAFINSGELMPLRPGLVSSKTDLKISSAQSLQNSSQDQADLKRQDIEAAQRAFSQGVSSNNEMGLEFPKLIFNQWLSRYGKSVVAKYLYGNIPFVIKRTNLAQCDFEALQRISDRSMSGNSWRLKAIIATPIAVRRVNEWVYELHNYYYGISLGQLVNRNRYRICGDYLGAMHNALASALDRLHRDGIIHRDIRPENLFILFDGSLALLDCSFVCNENNTQNPVDSGSYTAPEQLQGKAIIRSDWYSLAATLLFAAIGYMPSYPFDDEVFSEIFSLNMGGFTSSDFDLTDCNEAGVYSAACTWVAMLNPDVNRRPNDLSEVLLREHSRASFIREIISILDMKDLGYLVLDKSGFRVMTKSDLDTELISEKRIIFDDMLKDSIRKHRDGKPNWVVGKNSIDIKP